MQFIQHFCNAVPIIACLAFLFETKIDQDSLHFYQSIWKISKYSFIYLLTLTQTIKSELLGILFCVL